MMHVISCTNCHKTGIFDISLKFTYRLRLCGKCHHLEDDTWAFWFCKSDCMFSWLDRNNVKTHGFPCLGCDRNGIASGWDGGFESNGICRICKGKGSVKTSETMDGYPPFKPLEQ